MLERLSPAERVVFVLPDVFLVPFDTIADTIGSRAPTCRQLAHRARRKIKESRVSSGGVEPAQDHVVTRAFIDACSPTEIWRRCSRYWTRMFRVSSTPAQALSMAGAEHVGLNILRFWG